MANVSRLQFASRTIFFLAASQASWTLEAADWRIVPSVSAQVELTDNVNQAPDADKYSATILTLTPGVSATLLGSRDLQFAANYSLTGIERYSGGGGNTNDVYHNLGANAKATVIKDLFFVDATANVSQVLTSLLGAPGNGNLNTGNLTTVGSYSLSPYLIKRFGTFATGTVRYTLSGALFNNNANDLLSNTLTASLNSGTQFNDLSWGLNYSLRDTAVSGDGSDKFEHYDLNLGYVLTRHIRAFGSVGHDHDQFDSVGNTISANSWTAGLGWTPNRRLSLDASVGHTYFGRTYSFDFSYRTHYSVWTASYSEGTSDISQLLLNTQPIVAWICDAGLFFAQGTLPPSGQTNCVPLGTAPVGSVPLGVANGVFISKTLRGGAVWSKSRTSVGLNVFDVRRIYEQIVGLPEDETRGIGITYGYRLKPTLSLSAGLSYTNDLVPADLSGLTGSRDDKLYTASVGLTKQFDRKTNGSLVFRRTERHSNDSTVDFAEDDLTATLRMTF
ncbi:MAG: TIGR03016 family PEP-CTERM system-associated outer membrane protein [Thiobacillaceae bacterium]